jgi:hypothetical protein
MGLSALYTLAPRCQAAHKKRPLQGPLFVCRDRHAQGFVVPPPVMTTAVPSVSGMVLEVTPVDPVPPLGAALVSVG